MKYKLKQKFVTYMYKKKKKFEGNRYSSSPNVNYSLVVFIDYIKG